MNYRGVALAIIFSLGLATTVVADPPSLEQRIQALEGAQSGVDQRIQALERTQSGVFSASVNGSGAISARNFPDGAVTVRRVRTGLYEIDFGSRDIYNAAILVSAVSNDGLQPVFINAGNSPEDPNHKFWVQTWKGPERTTGDDHHRGNFQADSANFRFLVLIP